MAEANQVIYAMQANLCKALSNPVRLMIIDMLKNGEKTVTDLVRELNRSQSNLSQHLGVLRDRRIVKSRREGANVFYSLATPKIAEACTLVREILKEQVREIEGAVRPI